MGGGEKSQAEAHIRVRHLSASASKLSGRTDLDDLGTKGSSAGQDQSWLFEGLGAAFLVCALVVVVARRVRRR